MWKSASASGFDPITSCIEVSFGYTPNSSVWFIYRWNERLHHHHTAVFKVVIPICATSPLIKLLPDGEEKFSRPQTKRRAFRVLNLKNKVRASGLVTPQTLWVSPAKYVRVWAGEPDDLVLLVGSSDTTASPSTIQCGLQHRIKVYSLSGNAGIKRRYARAHWVRGNVASVNKRHELVAPSVLLHFLFQRWICGRYIQNLLHCRSYITNARWCETAIFYLLHYLALFDCYSRSWYFMQDIYIDVAQNSVRPTQLFPF